MLPLGPLGMQARRGELAAAGSASLASKMCLFTTFAFGDMQARRDELEAAGSASLASVASVPVVFPSPAATPAAAAASAAAARIAASTGAAAEVVPLAFGALAAVGLDAQRLLLLGSLAALLQRERFVALSLRHVAAELGQDHVDRPLLCTKSRWCGIHSMPPAFKARTYSKATRCPFSGKTGAVGSE